MNPPQPIARANAGSPSGSKENHWTLGQRGHCCLRGDWLVSQWSLAAVCGGLLGLVACTSHKPYGDVAHSATRALFVHLGVGFGDAKRLLSFQVHFAEPFLVAGDDYWQLSGRVEKHGDKIVADLTGSTGGQGGGYKGAMRLEEPFGSQGGAASGGAGYMWFGISTNSDPMPLINKVNEQYRRAIEKANKGEPGGALDGSQPIRSETNSTPGAAGSGRRFMP